MRKLLSAVAATVVVGAGLATAGLGTATAGAATPHRAGSTNPGHHTGYQPPAIDWGRCASSRLRDAGARCGFVVVPLDYARPHGAKVELAVSRIKHTTRHGSGPMLVNPGGPGGSGLSLARLGAYVPNHAGAAYDWIGFDPRGVGSSVPSLSCDDAFFAAGRPSYDPADGTGDYWTAKTSAYAKDCATSSAAALLRHTDTRTWVRDMDMIRKALHAPTISYYGFSYGTYLGQVYATQHPYRVKRFVFDGVVNPKDVWYQANLEQDKQFDANIDHYFDWIAQHDAEYGLGTDGAAVRQVYYDTLHQLAADPTATFGAADWNDDFTTAAYYVYYWDELAHVLVAAAHGDLGPAKEWYGDPTGAGADNTYANYLAVQCADAPWPTDVATWDADNAPLAQTKPFLTWNNYWYNMPCRTWSAPSGTAPRVNGAKVPPILLIEETNDAATPWAGAIEVRRLFPRSVLLEGVGGTTHAGSLSGVACTDDTVARYLSTGKLPARRPGQGVSDKKCDPVPPPAATPVGAARTPAGTATRAARAQRQALAQYRLGGLRELITSAASVRY